MARSARAARPAFSISCLPDFPRGLSSLLDRNLLLVTGKRPTRSLSRSSSSNRARRDAVSPGDSIPVRRERDPGGHRERPDRQLLGPACLPAPAPRDRRQEFLDHTHDFFEHYGRRAIFVPRLSPCPDLSPAPRGRRNRMLPAVPALHHPRGRGVMVLTAGSFLFILFRIAREYLRHRGPDRSALHPRPIQIY